MLGVVHALAEWRCYVEGSKISLVTDHDPLTFFDMGGTSLQEIGQMAGDIGPLRLYMEASSRKK